MCLVLESHKLTSSAFLTNKTKLFLSKIGLDRWIGWTAIFIIMILQVLKIISAELENFLDTFAGDDASTKRVVIGNIAFHDVEKYQPNSVDTSIDDKIVLSLVNVEEESSLKNNQHYTRDLTAKTTDYHNPKVNINLYVMFTCNATFYENAMTYLSRIIRFFQSKNVFTETNSVAISGINPLDQFGTFKIMMDLHTPSFEQANHLWGMLGGKQLPYVMYKIRVLDLEFRRILGSGKLVEEIHIVEDASGETVIVTEENQ